MLDLAARRPGEDAPALFRPGTPDPVPIGKGGYESEEEDYSKAHKTWKASITQLWKQVRVCV